VFGATMLMKLMERLPDHHHPRRRYSRLGGGRDGSNRPGDRAMGERQRPLSALGSAGGRSGARRGASASGWLRAGRKKNTSSTWRPKSSARNPTDREKTTGVKHVQDSDIDRWVRKFGPGGQYVIGCAAAQGDLEIHLLNVQPTVPATSGVISAKRTQQVSPR
jgi:hypothetical protein